MLYCAVSAETDINETSASKECNICLYWYFWIKNVSFYNMFVMDIMRY